MRGNCVCIGKRLMMRTQSDKKMSWERNVIMNNKINIVQKSQAINAGKIIYPIILLLTVAFITFFILSAVPSYGNENIANKTKTTTNKEDTLPDMNEFIPVDTEPVVTYRHPPEYPKIAENAGITGSVYVKALIDKKGNILKSEVYKSSGYVWLDESAKDATIQNKYKPALYKEKPVLYWVTHKVDFILE